jgi:hypothetical protein
MLHLKMNIKLPTVALAALLFAGLPLASSSAQIGLSVSIAPPLIPIYEQPYCPVQGYIWTPGYWAYDGFGYYWVPGVWVAPPRIGVLWTPGYWGYNSGNYFFNQGYWGPTVGFYGGINYGYGYGGQGYYGGQWAGNVFRYNTAVSRVNTALIQNTYVNREFASANTGSRASFNGPGGAKAKPTAKEQAAAKAEHVPPTPEQRSRVEAAKNNPDLHAANNRGKPKPEAIKALDRNNGQQPAAAAAAGGPAGTEQTGAGKHAGAEKAKGGATQVAGGPAGTEQAGAGKHAGAEKAKGGTAQAANASHPTAKAARTHEAAAPHAAKATQAKHNGPANNAAAAPHAAQHAQVAPHRPQAVSARQAAPAARGRAPAPAAQPAKKKKPAKEAPGGER